VQLECTLNFPRTRCQASPADRRFTARRAMRAGCAQGRDEVRLLAVLGPAAGDTTGQQALVHGADVAQHVPDCPGDASITISWRTEVKSRGPLRRGRGRDHLSQRRLPWSVPRSDSHERPTPSSQPVEKGQALTSSRPAVSASRPWAAPVHLKRQPRPPALRGSVRVTMPDIPGPLLQRENQALPPQPGGDRQANRALYMIVLTRMGRDPATRAYVERRTTEGLPKEEVIRCLKRYVAGRSTSSSPARSPQPGPTRSHFTNIGASSSDQLSWTPAGHDLRKGLRARAERVLTCGGRQAPSVCHIADETR
jgi:hypothetical protein